MEIHQSAEDYLECILKLSKCKPVVRSIDIAVEMKYGSQWFYHADGCRIEVAERIYERHLLLTKGLKSLGVDDEIAAKDACKIEHDLSPESFEALKKYIEENLDK